MPFYFVVQGELKPVGGSKILRRSSDDEANSEMAELTIDDIDDPNTITIYPSDGEIEFVLIEHGGGYRRVSTGETIIRSETFILLDRKTGHKIVFIFLKKPVVYKTGTSSEE